MARQRIPLLSQPPQEEPSVEFIHSGCTVLDCVLGGGWAKNRIFNVVGDNSTGKTLLAIESMANFIRQYGKHARASYAEGEAAFDKPYAQSLGMPIEHVRFVADEFAQREAAEDAKRKHRSKEDVDEDEKQDKKKKKTHSGFRTVEDFYLDVRAEAAYCRQHNVHGLYILDSLDSLSTEGELSREFGDATYGTDKAKDLSEMFRRLTSEIAESNLTLGVISQIRDNIGVMFGAKYKRSGGNALNFYASQILYLAEGKKIKRTIRSVEREIGIHVTAKCTKNKVGMPHRTCAFPIVYGYGIDDLQASLEWLSEIDQIETVGLTKKTLQTSIKEINTTWEIDEIRKFTREVANTVQRYWREIEQGFAPRRAKYGA